VKFLSDIDPVYGFFFLHSYPLYLIKNKNQKNQRAISKGFFEIAFAFLAGKNKLTRRRPPPGRTPAASFSAGSGKIKAKLNRPI
jgi:hypothetical protein